MPLTAGYSGASLAKKLGFKERSLVLLMDAPEEYSQFVGTLPQGVQFASRPNREVDMVHVFATRRTTLAKHLSKLRKTLKVDAAVWVSWPKKTSKVASDITEHTIRDIALPLGFVDIKVCAVTDIWSGLKLVVRKELR